VSWYLTKLFIRNKPKNLYLLGIFGVALKFVALQSEVRDLTASVTLAEE